MTKELKEFGFTQLYLNFKDSCDAPRHAGGNIIYSSLYEVVVDFTRDYDSIRNALHKIEHYDKTCLENVLVAVNNAFKAHWGSQNYCQIIFITDCGVGMGPSSLKNTIINLQSYKAACAAAATAAAATSDGSKTTGTVGSNSAAIPAPGENQWVGFSYPSKLSFMCLGSLSTDSAFRCGTKLYMQLLEVSGQKGQLFIPRMKMKQEESGGSETPPTTGDDSEDVMRQLTRASALESFATMCDINYRQFEATLRCGGYFRLEEPVTVWPAPLPYTARDVLGAETTKLMSRRLEVCGFLRMSDIGSPMSVSRHLILPRNVGSLVVGSSDEGGKPSTNGGLKNGHGHSSAEERLEADIKAFYAKSDTADHHQHEDHGLDGADVNKESVCVLLHGALKVENMAALVLVGDNWYGFIYSYADGKKKWNLMLNVLPPGSDVVPWLGDLRYLGTLEDAFQGENPSFPIKADKRSYSQTIVVWIRHASLQSDIQKVLRHAKKLPEKTQHFYKELNRIRRAALSLGFVELLEGLAHIFEREISTLPLNASPDCSMQLTHAAIELRKTNNRDLKSVIHALPTQYNQLA